MKRILYFTGYRLVAQEWHGNKLETSVYFEPDEQGLDLFNAYLRSFRHEPVRLLVDLIEEEFRQIKIPLLRGSDRKAILDRNYAKFFRNVKHKFAVSQSIEKKTRKEEKLLIIGLTNQNLLEPWLQIIDDTCTPLSGIISLPLLAEDFIGHLETDHKAVILVSQQVPSNLRQSVFINGKLVLSRLVPIASFYQGDYATDVIRDLESTQRYLTGQRMIERADTVSIQIITNKRHVDKLMIKCSQEGFQDFKIHDVNDLLSKENIEISEQQDFSSGLFCYFATRKFSINHYAQAKEKKYYRHYIANVVLKAASMAFFAIGFGLMTTSAAKGWIYSNTVAETALIEQKYQAKFNQLSNSRIDSTTSTSTMQHIVQAVETIQKNYLDDPGEMVALVSQDISLFPDIRIKNFDWFISRDPNANSVADVSWGKAKRNKKNNPVKKKSSVNSYFEIAVVEGEFLEFDGNYRYVLSVVDDLEKAMTESGNYFQVEITRRPLNIESDKQITGDVSIRTKTRFPTAELAFRVVREVIPDE
ncbi:MAG: hypothetical protein E2O60_04145 [Gammaproteobacteria bacterium]|nr:MAG: hypothetical protein E2O60_04145 [Gammaproteobacteria bacterium]